MSKSIKAVLVLGIATLVAACGGEPEPAPVVEPAPIVEEPVSGKF